MDRDPSICYNTIKTDQYGVTHGIYVCRTSHEITLEYDTDVHVASESLKGTTDINSINHLLTKRFFEIIHDRHDIKTPTDWSKVSGLNCNFDLCPDLIEGSGMVEDIRINVRADFISLNMAYIPDGYIKKFIYKIKVYSDNSSRTKIIEIDKPNLECLKEDPIGFVLYNNIVNIGDIIPRVLIDKIDLYYK